MHHFFQNHRPWEGNRTRKVNTCTVATLYWKNNSFKYEGRVPCKDTTSCRMYSIIIVCTLFCELLIDSSGKNASHHKMSGVHFNEVNETLPGMAWTSSQKVRSEPLRESYLAGWRRHVHTRCGPKRRWWDIVKKDSMQISMLTLGMRLHLTEENGINHVLRELLIINLSITRSKNL